MTLQWVAKSISNFKPANFMHVRTGAHNEDTKRAYESGNDAYLVFRKMLESGHPPDDWAQLLAECKQHGGHTGIARGKGSTR